MLRDVEIHSARIRFQPLAVFRREIRINAMRDIAKLQQALHLVVPEQGRSHHLGEFAIGAPPIGIHLPQPVLRSHVSLGDEQVFLRRGVDVGNPMLIASNSYGRGEALNTLSVKMEVTIKLRQCSFGRTSKPEHEHPPEEGERDQYPQTANNQNPRPAVTTRSQASGIRLAIW